MNDNAGWRLLLWCGLVLGWLYMLLRMWNAFATFPTPERLDQSRLVTIPTLASLAMVAGRSLAELAAVLALTWPWSSRLWLTRVSAAAVLLAGWFVLTTPLGISAVTWVHRRWLAAMVAGLVLVATATIIGRLTTLLSRRLLKR
jgi:hypothetical protein